MVKNPLRKKILETRKSGLKGVVRLVDKGTGKTITDSAEVEVLRPANMIVKEKFDHFFLWGEEGQGVEIYVPVTVPLIQPIKSPLIVRLLCTSRNYQPQKTNRSIEIISDKEQVFTPIVKREKSIDQGVISSFKGEYFLKGQLYDAEDTGISHIRVLAPGQEKETYTDQQGAFQFKFQTLFGDLNLLSLEFELSPGLTVKANYICLKRGFRRELAFQLNWYHQISLEKIT